MFLKYSVVHVERILVIPRKSVRPFCRNVVNRQEFLPQKSMKKLLYPRFRWDIRKMLQILPCTMAHLSWQFHENPFTGVFAMLLITTWMCHNQLYWSCHGLTLHGQGGIQKYNSCTSGANQAPGPWFNIKMLSYQYRKSHCGDKTILRPSYLHNGISYTGKMTSLYWIGAQGSILLTEINLI